MTIIRRAVACSLLIAFLFPLLGREVTTGAFTFQGPDKWTQKGGAPGALGIFEDPGQRAWVFYVAVNKGQQATLEDGLRLLIDPQGELGAYLTQVRLTKLSYCESRDKIKVKKKDKKDRKKKKDKKKKKKHGKKKARRDKGCELASYTGKGRAKFQGQKKVRFRFRIVEKNEQAFLLVVAGKKGYLKEKKKEGELKGILKSIKYIGPAATETKRKEENDNDDNDDD